MNKFVILFIVPLSFAFGALSPDVDLETLTQDYVLDVKQLHIPGFPTACNASIVRWKNKFILSFDAYSLDKEDQPDLMGLAVLDQEFNLTGKPQILDVPKNLWQDARLIVHQEDLYLVFNGAIDDGVRRMYIARAHFNGIEFSVESPKALLNFPGENPTQWERNWVPFIYNDSLLLTSRFSPHTILRPLLDSQTCVEAATSEFMGHWTWGTPRPGTCAYLDGEHYLAFFHSSKVMRSLHSEGKPVQHYFMGAYTFENKPPFRITSMSKEPIVGKHFYHGPEYTMCKPCRVVFPCGYVMDEQFIWIVYGRQDHEIWVAKLDKDRLNDSLDPCN